MSGMELTPAQAWNALIDGLQLLTRLEPDGLPRRNVYLRASAGIAPDSGLTWPDVKYAEATEFDPLTVAQRFFHAFKDSLHGQLCFGLGDTCLIDHFVDDIELNHLGQLSSIDWKGT